jgi:thioredoxin-dependent peroxiredoxin
MRFGRNLTFVLALLLGNCLTNCEQKGGDGAASPSGSVDGELEPNGALAVGAPAPSLKATAHNGEVVDLSALRDRPVVVYFYPKDDTPGCTIEAQEIRDLWSELQGTRAVVIGVSTDDGESHKAFAEKYALPFLLLPDTDHAISKAFGVELKNGKASRTSFLIGRDGKVAKLFSDVNPRGHGRELLDAIKAL